MTEGYTNPDIIYDTELYYFYANTYDVDYNLYHQTLYLSCGYRPVSLS